LSTHKRYFYQLIPSGQKITPTRIFCGQRIELLVISEQFSHSQTSNNLSLSKILPISIILLIFSIMNTMAAASMDQAEDKLYGYDLKEYFPRTMGKKATAPGANKHPDCTAAMEEHNTTEVIQELRKE
jgi:hypothetical protein